MEITSLVAWLLARSQYPESPATGHLGTVFSWFPCVYKRMLRWFPRLQVATAWFPCSPPELNFLDPCFIFMYMHYNHCHRETAHLQLSILLLSSPELTEWHDMWSPRDGYQESDCLVECDTEFWCIYTMSCHSVNSGDDNNIYVTADGLSPGGSGYNACT